jgi:hypothetical protein
MCGKEHISSFYMGIKTKEPDVVTAAILCDCIKAETQLLTDCDFTTATERREWIRTGGIKITEKTTRKKRLDVLSPNTILVILLGEQHIVSFYASNTKSKWNDRPYVTAALISDSLNNDELIDGRDFPDLEHWAG